ncbi:Hypothetical protein NocV09_00400560 [Nannochloropsis oceanica]
MYNLGEKKSFINDLASKLLGGQAILGTGHHHHRNLTTQVLSLEDLVLFKIQEFRLQFLAKCLQIHTLSGKNHLVLSLTHFDLLTDVLRVILREANNQEDHLSIRMVYLVSELSGTYLGHGGQGGHLFLRTLKMALSKHEAWQNLGFYEHVLDECVARDKQHWMHLQGPLSEILSFEIHNEEIIALLLSFRFKALLGAIEQLKMGEEGGQVKEGLIEGLLDYCRRVHGVEFERGQVMGPLETPFMLWLLDVAVRAWQLPKLEEGGAGGLEKGDASQSRGSSCSGSRGGGVETYVQTMRRRSSLSSMACSTTAKSSARRPSEQQLAPGRRKRSEDVGCSYSSKPSSLAATTAATGAGDDSSPPYHAQSRRYRSSSSVSSTSSSSASPRNPASTKIDNSNHHTVRRDQERACSRMSSSSSSSSSSPFSYPSSTSVSMPLSHPLTSLQSTARANRRSSSGPRDATMVSASRRREERENMHLTLLREEGMEVLKHGRFGCVIPHYRFLFVDREELYWCRREEVGKRKRQQQQQQQQRRGKGSLLLRNLMQVKLRKRARIVSLEFKERSLVVEALGGEEFDVLAGIFTRVMSENMGGNRGPVVITRGKRY